MKTRSIALALCLVATPALAQGPAAPGTPANAPAPKVAPAGVANEDVLPRGAPKDDYEFVGWCTGALSGHMELYTRVKPELDDISKRWKTEEEDAKDYADQQAAGRAAQLLFARSMRAAEQAAPRDIKAQGQAAVASGVAMWKEINTVDARNQAYSWMNWELPPRCEKIAASLEQKSTLMGALLRDNGGVSTGRIVAPALPKAAPPAAK